MIYLTHHISHSSQLNSTLDRSNQLSLTHYRERSVVKSSCCSLVHDWRRQRLVRLINSLHCSWQTMSLHQTHSERQTVLDNRRPRPASLTDWLTHHTRRTHRIAISYGKPPTYWPTTFNQSPLILVGHDLWRLQQFANWSVDTWYCRWQTEVILTVHCTQHLDSQSADRVIITSLILTHGRRHGVGKHPPWKNQGGHCPLWKF